MGWRLQSEMMQRSTLPWAMKSQNGCAVQTGRLQKGWHCLLAIASREDPHPHGSQMARLTMALVVQHQRSWISERTAAVCWELLNYRRGLTLCSCVHRVG